MKSLPRTKAAKRQAKKLGRPCHPDAIRTASGRLSRAKGARQHMTATEERLMLEAATWKRRQANPQLTVHEARQQEHGSVISAWLLAYQRHQKAAPGEPFESEFTQMHYDAAERFHKLYLGYQRIAMSRKMRSSSDFGGAGGHDGGDPFTSARSAYEVEVEQAYRDARRKLLEMQDCPLALMALETIVIENKAAHSLLPDLRCALNRLARLWNWLPQAA